jgi:uncharacterized membrane protein HdeD (DUF308 family)
MESNLQLKPAKTQGEARGFARHWWLNFVRGIAALMLGIGLLLPVEVILEADRVQVLLLQFIGIYLLISGVMSLIWGFSNRRRLGLWLMAGVLGIVGGSAFFLRSTLEDTLSPTILTAIFGFIMLLAGLMHIFGGFRLGEKFGRRWSWGHLFLGLVEMGIGLLVFLSIFISVENLRVLLSFWGLVAGAGLIADGVRMRNQKNKLEESQVKSEHFAETLDPIRVKDVTGKD